MNTEELDEIDLGQTLTEPTQERGTEESEERAAIDPDDFTEEPEEEPWDDEPEENGEPDNEKADPKDLAELMVLFSDLGQTSFFSHTFRKRFLKRFKPEDRKRFREMETMDIPEPRELEEKERWLFQEVQRLHRELEEIPYTEGERDQLSRSLAEVIKKYNIRLTPEMMLLGNVLMVFGGRAFKMYKA